MKFTVIAKERVNAWNCYPNEAVGAIYVRRAGEENGKVKVEALQVVCPHAGCAIAYEPGEKGGRFFCPCHSASFDLEGKRNQAASPSPRDMDSLAVEILDGGKIRVRFQTFSTGTARKAVQT